MSSFHDLDALPTERPFRGDNNRVEYVEPCEVVAKPLTPYFWTLYDHHSCKEQGCVSKRFISFAIVTNADWGIPTAGFCRFKFRIMQEQARAQGLKAPFRSKCANCGNAFKTEEVMLGIFDDFIWCNRCVGVRAGALDEQPPRALSEYSPPRRSTRPAQTDSPVSKASRHGLFTPQTPESKTKGGRPAFPPSAVPENRGGPSGLAHVTSKSQGSKNRSTTISTPTKSSENDKGALSRKAHGEGEELDVDPNESAESSDDDLDDDEDD